MILRSTREKPFFQNWIIFSLVLVWAIGLAGCRTEKKEKRRILVVHSYEEEYAAYPDFNKLIAKEFASYDINAEIRTVYLDCESYREQQELEWMYDLLDSAVAWRPEVILVNEDQATYSLLKCAHPLTKEVSIVFAGVNYPNWGLLRHYPNVTGFHDKMDVLENIRVIEEITRGKAMVYSLLDSTFLDLKIRKEVTEQLAGTEIQVVPVAGTNFRPGESLQQRRKEMRRRDSTVFQMKHIRKLTRGEEILWSLGKYSNSAYYLQVKRDFISVNVANLSSNMSFSAINDAVGYDEGLLGGYFSSMQTQVKDEVGAAVRILNGESPMDIPVRESDKEYILDWKVMERWHIGKEDVSEKYQIINMPFFVRYQWQSVLMIVLLSLGLIYLVVYLVWLYCREVDRKKSVMDNLRKEKESLALSVKTLKEREQELIEARKLAEKAELKQSFLANMSHEIRTPLNAIVGFANLLASDQQLAEEDRKEFIDTINRNCELLLKLINDVLELSRLESGYMSFHYEVCRLKKLMEEIYRTHQMLIPAQLEFVREFPEEDVEVRVDRLRFTQVITNLLNNAAKFTQQGSIKLGFSYREEVEEVSIFVEDTGKGIPEEEQKMIFSRFYKQDEFIQGTGLGLAICEVIIGKLGGSIGLTSVVGKGSCFTVTLPCRFVGSEAEKEGIVPGVVPYSPFQRENDRIRKDRPVILVAEDSESNYMLLQVLLQKDYDLVWVKTGRDAVNEVLREAPDLVLMDIKMPEMNGIEALIEIRKFNRELPVVMQTAYAFDTDKEMAQKAGCNGFLTKPISREDLKKCLDKLFGKETGSGSADL